jgi:hypothetical protein
MDDKILKKIKKCLALAKSSNPNEAATALRQAQALMREHGISAESVELSDVTEKILHVREAKKPTLYFVRLVQCIIYAFGVDATYTIGQFGNRITWIGIDHTPEIASYAFDVLFRQVKRDRAAYVASLSNRLKSSSKTRKGDVFASAWVNEVVEMVSKFAVPDKQQALIAKYCENRMQNTTPVTGRAAGYNERSDYDAVIAGSLAGKKAQLNHGVAGASQARLAGAS